jgi:sigma-B regulation protein RsbU (phosphoserine phosphatase)
MKILIAEDERISRRSLERQLTSWGHEVTVAEDGEAAWLALELGQFEVLISDWDMPKMDGPTLIGKVRAADRAKYIYVIMLTARGGTEDLVRGIEAGADDFLTKPFESNELKVRLRAGERVLQLQERLADQNKQLLAVNTRMSEDLNAAALVQQSIMPERPPEVNSLRSAWRYVPCDELAGDALNVFALDERYVCFYVLDVSGHGVSAALLSVAVARSLWLSDDLTSLILKGTNDESGFGRFALPATVMTRLNHRFPFEENGNRFFTMVYALLDVVEGTMTYCCAGHPGPIRVGRDGAVEVFEPSSPMIGIVPEPEYENVTLKLRAGDRAYLYSDGVFEQRSPEGEFFGTSRFATELQRAASLPLDGALDRAIGQLKRWAGSEQFNDDVSLLALEWLA